VTQTKRRSRKGRVRYRNFIVTCWRESDAGAGWRFTMIDARTGERRSFHEISGLTEFLHMHFLLQGKTDE